ncbi:MAG: alpha/beta-type small acid-soluble spore protein [Halanaerobium sp.]|nr:alpha/beta-type small acid-soluble spore protein [Halanaerobium sp.]
MNPLARQALDSLKYEVAEELGYFNHQDGVSREAEYNNALDQMKNEVAQELGIDLKPDYNGDMTTRDAGRIGGQLGGHIGGNMVRKMIRFAEDEMAKRRDNQ